MKELYTKPVVDLEKFDAVDVIVTSFDIDEDYYNLDD